MNYYHCYGFSEIDKHRQEVDILIAHHDINKARMVASWYVTNISHFDDYPIDIKEFGIGQFTVNHEGESIEIISALSTLKEGFKVLTDVGMNVTSVNSLEHPLKPALQKIVWGMLRKEFGLSNDDPFTDANEDEDPIEGQELTPVQIIRITNLITNVLHDAKELYVQAKTVIGGESVIMFARSIELLQDTLSQGNISLAKEQTKRLIPLMEQVESEYIDFERARDHEVQSQITIPNLNTILMNNQRVTADKVYSAQMTERSKVEQWYQTLYHKFVKKILTRWKGAWSEFNSTVGLRGTILTVIRSYIEYVLIFMSIIIVLLLRGSSHETYWGSILYTVGFVGVAVQVTHLIEIRRPLVRLGVIGVSCVMLGFVSYLLASNLALI